MSMISHHAALIYAMIVGSAADGDISEEEINSIGEMMTVLPIFADFERSKFAEVAGACNELLTNEEGIEAAIGMIKESLPDKLCQTAYALACDVVAADGIATQEELRYLEMLRHGLNVDQLTAAAIERGSAARYARLPRE
jgi:tellurite resistance protein